ncbi:MAG: hypothetical protein EHM72_16475 [Calditrichaeota bacterium]|nr:MAG: hypothetical protein EHM72_16475 [Calditrichota bacterium]
MRYIAIIADIIKSKEIDHRNQFQSELAVTLQKINTTSSSIISPYTITLGDEFQAVYRDGEWLLRDLLTILIKVFPIQMRFAIGYGGITTDINREKSIGMDGPAFYEAREGLTLLKKLNHSVIQFYGDPFPHKELANKSLQLAFSLMSDWKKNTLTIFNELFNQQLVKNIGPTVRISERGVYKIIDTQRLRDFVEYFLCLETEVKRLGVE